MTDEPVLIGPGEGEDLGRNFLILGGRDELVLTEFNYPPGEDGPRRHIHRHHADAFYVLDGRLRITLDEEDVVLDPGAFVLIPPGVIHSFGNPDPQPGRYLNLHAPGCGFDEYLRGRFKDFDQDYDVPPGSGRPTDAVVLRQPGDGEQLAIGASRALVKAGSEDGMGSLSILESTAAPGFPGPPLHVHDHTVDSFFVIDGTLMVHLDGRQAEATPGSYVLVPPGTPHTFSNPTDKPVRFLNIMAPGGFEAYLREAAGRGEPPDAAEYDFRAI